MKKIEFELKKIHVDKKFVVITYLTKGSDREKTEKVKETPHPDLKVSLQAFRPIMTEMFEQPDSEQTEHDITGITLSTKKGNDQVIISSTYTLASNQKVSMNSPNIALEGSDWDNQDKLSEQIKSVSDEAYAYLFDGKAAQLSLDVLNPEQNNLDIE